MLVEGEWEGLAMSNSTLLMLFNKSYLVKWVKITLIFANLTHRLKNKKKIVDWDKNALPFISLLPLIISHLLLNLTFYRMAPHLLLKKSQKKFSSSFSTSFSSFGAQNGKLIFSLASFTNDSSSFFFYFILFL